MRKVIQIAVSTDDDEFGEIVALCDDGTIWRAIADGHGLEEWTECAPVPGTWAKQRQEHREDE